MTTNAPHELKPNDSTAIIGNEEHVLSIASCTGRATPVNRFISEIEHGVIEVLSMETAAAASRRIVGSMWLKPFNCNQNIQINIVKLSDIQIYIQYYTVALYNSWVRVEVRMSCESPSVYQKLSISTNNQSHMQ